MKRLLIGLSLLLLSAGASFAQCPVNLSPGFTGGGNLWGSNASQVNQYFQQKVDTNNGVACNFTLQSGKVTGALNWTFPQVFPSVTIQGGTVSGALTWSIAQSFPGITSTTPYVGSGSALTGITYSQISGTLVQHARITLTSAQILALSTTPVTIIPAQGAGTVIVVNQASLALNYGGTAYSGSGVLGFCYPGNTALRFTTFNVAALTTAANISSFANGFNSTGGVTNTGVSGNAPVDLTLSSALTTGNSTADIDVWFTVAPL